MQATSESAANHAARVLGQEPDWKQIGAQLQEPFDPEDVDARIMTHFPGDSQATVAFYINSRAVQDRLDRVVGPGNWGFNFDPIVTEELAKGNGNTVEMTKAKGTITIHGVSKSDVGTLSNTEATKGCVSDAFKRAAVMWGIGRYLYSIPNAKAPVKTNQDGKRPRLEEETIKKLRTLLPKPGSVSSRQQLSPTAQASVAIVEQAGFQVDEVRVTPHQQPAQAQQAQPSPADDEPVTAQQQQAIWTYARQLWKPLDENGRRDKLEEMTGGIPVAAISKAEGRNLIESLRKLMESGVSQAPAQPAPAQTTAADPGVFYKAGFDPEHPQCPKCGGDMWDARAKIKSGEYKATAAHFTCKDRNCMNETPRGSFRTGVWPERNNPNANRDMDREAFSAAERDTANEYTPDEYPDE